VIFQLYKYIPFGDKIGHFLLMAIFSFLMNCTLKNKTLGLYNTKVLTGSIIVFTLITIEEFSQLGNENRNFDLIDLAFNYLGIIVGGLCSTRRYLDHSNLSTK